MQNSRQNVTTNKPTSSVLQAGCPSCHPTNSVKALKIDSTGPSLKKIGYKIALMQRPQPPDKIFVTKLHL